MYIYGNTDNTVTIIGKHKKGKYLKSLKQYHILIITKQGTHLNEFSFDNNNHIFELIYQNLKKCPDGQQHVNFTQIKTNKLTLRRTISYQHTTRHTAKLSDVLDPYNLACNIQSTIIMLIAFCLHNTHEAVLTIMILNTTFY